MGLLVDLFEVWTKILVKELPVVIIINQLAFIKVWVAHKLFQMHLVQITIMQISCQIKFLKLTNKIIWLLNTKCQHLCPFCQSIKPISIFMVTISRLSNREWAHLKSQTIIMQVAQELNSTDFCVTDLNYLEYQINQ